MLSKLNNGRLEAILNSEKSINSLHRIFVYENQLINKFIISFKE